MTDRPDLRAIAGDVREALADADRDTLIDVLTYVFEEYVIESPPPGRTPPAETLDELAGLSFPALIEALKLRLDHPELSLFRVQGAQVFVRVGGALAPLDPDAADGAAELSRESSLPTVAEQGPGPGAAEGSASGSGSAECAASQRSGGPCTPRAADAAALAPTSDEAEPGDDDASIRFSLLELD